MFIMKNIRHFCKINGINTMIDVRSDIKESLKRNNPVVALESTIISHGMPYPHNIKTAIEVENIVRDQVQKH